MNKLSKILFIALQLFCMALCLEAIAKENSASPKEIIVVFQKIISKEQALKIMTAFQAPYREGMDSSRGKKYFYSTGPKFIVKVVSEKLANFLKGCAEIKEIHECYVADWDVIKD